MPTYKIITTVTWKIEADCTPEECLSRAKTQIDQIIETNPHGKEFDGFSVQMEIAKMKDRKRMIHVGSFDIEEVFSHVTHEDEKREYHVGDKSYLVRMNSERYILFKRNRKCVACGIEGKHMYLDLNPGDKNPHFNLYAEENGRLVMMTKDHVLPKSKGGKDVLDNFVTCCVTCNNLKGNSFITYEQLGELRTLFNNSQMLPAKELRELINNRRQEMSGGHHERHDAGDQGQNSQKQEASASSPEPASEEEHQHGGSRSHYSVDVSCDCGGDVLQEAATAPDHQPHGEDRTTSTCGGELHEEGRFGLEDRCFEQAS